jgi:hypothetical protein
MAVDKRYDCTWVAAATYGCTWLPTHTSCFVMLRLIIFTSIKMVGVVCIQQM